MRPEIIYQFKVSLNGCSPRIWRRIQVSSECSFFDLHIAIQDAMGWSDSHLHAFYLQRQGKRPVTVCLPNPDDWGDVCERDERLERIADYFGLHGKQCQYCYDFGDGWDHTVVFERELPAVLGEAYPLCVAGKNACPPEDCGGVWGYEDLNDIIRNPQHEEHRDTLEWLCVESPDEFDATEFNPQEVQFRDSREERKYAEKVLGIEPVDKEEEGLRKSSVAARVVRLKIMPLKRYGIWEVDQRAEPLLGFDEHSLAHLRLTTVVSQESYFIFNTKVASPNEPFSATDALLEGIEKNNVLPEEIIVKKKELLNELRPLATSLGVRIELVTKFKATPVVIRDMRRAFARVRSAVREKL